jgi:hypothetical protein
MQIEEFIPKGYRNRVSRGYLAEILHMTDRSIRDEISDARKRGVLIASCGGGYFQRKDESDEPYIREYYATECHRFTTIANSLKTFRKTWKGDDQIAGQMRLEL